MTALNGRPPILSATAEHINSFHDSQDAFHAILAIYAAGLATHFCILNMANVVSMKRPVPHLIKPGRIDFFAEQYQDAEVDHFELWVDDMEGGTESMNQIPQRVAYLFWMKPGEAVETILERKLEQ